MLMNLAELGAIAVAAVIGAAVIMMLMKSGKTPDVQPNLTFNPMSGDGTVFLFSDSNLIDATADAWDVFGHGSNSLDDLNKMIAILAKEFPQFKDKLADPAAMEFRICSESDPTVFVDARRTDDRLRIAINGDESWTRKLAALRLSCDASNAEAALMRDITTHSSQLVWHEDRHGTLLWANHAYTRTLRELGVKDLIKTKDMPAPGHDRRLAVKAMTGETEKWFDISTISHADGLLCFADDATEIVRASTSKTQFVETVGRTFAELSTGLAIFDKNRLLTMFNPAFLDMTNLPIDFLTARPAIYTVLDRLRELRMMPEPKDYVSWRDQFTAVEAGAKNGTYSKNWSLADGQTYRVTGRPYPDGAFALLFEDISAEVSLTRRFRLDIETGQAVLDTLSDAIAVFSSAGTLVMSNRAYISLWSDGPEQVLEHRLLQTEMKTWQDQCIPSPMWNDMREFIQQLGVRPPWSDNALLDDGRHLSCHANRIAGGMTMVRFAIATPKRPEIRKLMLPDPAIQAAKR